MNKSDKIFLLSNIVLVGFFVAVIFHYICANVFHLGDPYNTFLLYPSWVLGDVTGLLDVSKNLYPFQTPNIMINYLPLAYLLLFPFALIKSQLVACYLLISIFLCTFSILNLKFFSCNNLTKLQNFQNIFILTIMTYPLLYLLERSNIDMFILFFMGAFVYAFKTKKYSLSSTLLAIMNAIKPLTLIFLVLYIYEKKWEELFFSLFLTFLLIIFGFMFLHGDFLAQLEVLKINLSWYVNKFIYDPFEGATNSLSIYLALKLILCGRLKLMQTALLYNIYTVISVFLTGFTIYFSWKEKVFWKRITLLTLYTLTVPYVVFDYKLIFLFIPIWLFVNTDKKSKYDLMYTILFALLLIPKKQIWLMGLYQFGVYVNPIIVLIFMGLIVFEQFKSKQIAGKVEAN